MRYARCSGGTCAAEPDPQTLPLPAAPSHRGPASAGRPLPPLSICPPAASRRFSHARTGAAVARSSRSRGRLCCEPPRAAQPGSHRSPRREPGVSHARTGEAVAHSSRSRGRLCCEPPRAAQPGSHRSPRREPGVSHARTGEAVRVAALPPDPFTNLAAAGGAIAPGACFSRPAAAPAFKRGWTKPTEPSAQFKNFSRLQPGFG